MEIVDFLPSIFWEIEDIRANFTMVRVFGKLSPDHLNFT